MLLRDRTGFIKIIPAHVSDDHGKLWKTVCNFIDSLHGCSIPGEMRDAELFIERHDPAVEQEGNPPTLTEVVYRIESLLFGEKMLDQGLKFHPFDKTVFKERAQTVDLLRQVIQVPEPGKHGELIAVFLPERQALFFILKTHGLQNRHIYPQLPVPLYEIFGYMFVKVDYLHGGIMVNQTVRNVNSRYRKCVKMNRDLELEDLQLCFSHDDYIAG